MNLVNKHDRCIGIVLWKWKQRFVQLWFCPSGYTIERHSHPEEDIELMYLFGSSEFFRVTSKVESFKPRWYHIGKRFSVKAGTVHWFEVSKWPLIFVNISIFLEGKKPKSAAIDFQKL